MNDTYIFEYLDENDFRKKERSVRKYNMLAYKKLTFNYYPEIRKGNFLGQEVSNNEKAPKGFEIESSFINDNYVHFDFACGEVNYENVKSFINILIDSKPHRLYDIDEQCGHIQLDIVAGGIEIGLTEK